MVLAIKVHFVSKTS